MEVIDQYKLVVDVVLVQLLVSDFMYTLAHATLFIDDSSSFNVLFPLFHCLVTIAQKYNCIGYPIIILFSIQQFHDIYQLLTIQFNK